MKLDQLYFSRQRGHSPSASMSKMQSPSSSVSPTIAQSFGSSSQHDISSIADQLNTISTTTTSVLTTLQTLMRRSKDNATELDSLRKQVLESKQQDSNTVDEIKKLISSSGSTMDLTALYTKLDSLRTQQETPPPPQPPPPPPPSAHKLDEEKAAVESILANANQAVTQLLTLTESINTLTTHLNSTSTRLTTEESQLESVLERKSKLEAEVARLEATIYLRNLELESFTKKAEVLESRIVRAKTAVQLSGSKHVKMKKSPLILGKGLPNTQVKDVVARETTVAPPLTPQRRILSLSSTNTNSPGRGMTEMPAGPRKSSWSKKLGGMLSGLTTSNKENAGENTRPAKPYLEGKVIAENDVVNGLNIPSSRGRSVSERRQ